jgi:microcystin-dependent protein
MLRSLRLAYPDAIGVVACSAVGLLVAGGAVRAQSTEAAGGGQPYANIKPSLTLRYLLCTQGQYPGQGDGTLWQTDRSVPMIGEIRVVAFSNTPSGFAECTGQIVGISQNIALFTLLYTNYGGNGVSTFQFPDLRGTVPIGAGQGPLLPNYVIGQRTGAETIALNTTQLPFHTHTIPSGNTGATGASATYSILQPSLALNFVIDANGEIALFAGTNAPYGWALCDGSLRQITNDNDAILYNVIGTTYGGDGVTTFALPDLRGRSPVGTGYNAVAGDYVLAQCNGASEITLFPSTMPLHNHPVPGGSTGNAGGSVSFDNRQPTLAMTWLIAYSGNSPNSEYGPPFYGEMRLFASNAPPSNTGWLPATGLFLPIASYTGLFTFIGTNFGGNGVSSFALPNLNGRMAASQGNSFSNLGTAFDQYLVSLSTNTMPSHTHALPGVPALVGLQQFPNGAFQFNFTNVPNNTFTVLTATNMDLPLSNWTILGTLTNFTPGYYQFTSAPTNELKRFFRVWMP